LITIGPKGILAVDFAKSDPWQQKIETEPTHSLSNKRKMDPTTAKMAIKLITF
jgi:hypothetical protein